MNVLVTGAGRGLAFELVKLHALKGDKVYALAHSLTPELKELEANHKNVEITLIELTLEEEVKTALSKIEEETLDTIYNVAGIWREDQMVGVEDTDIEKALKMYEVNALAPLSIMKYGKKLLKPEGRLVNVSSEAGSIGAAERKAEYGYCMSKAALNMASKLFMNETGKKVYCYHPGWLRTQMGGERAAASEYSISAKESAENLTALIYGEGGKAPAGMFFDYTNKEWPW